MHAVCVCLNACMHLCISVVQQQQCWHIIHFLRACSIVWPVQSVPILQKFGKGNWIHSRVGNLPPSEKLPTCYSIGPLQRRVWLIVCLLTIAICNYMPIQFSTLPLPMNLREVVQLYIGIVYTQLIDAYSTFPCSHKGLQTNLVQADSERLFSHTIPLVSNTAYHI